MPNQTKRSLIQILTQGLMSLSILEKLSLVILIIILYSLKDSFMVISLKTMKMDPYNYASTLIFLCGMALSALAKTFLQHSQNQKYKAPLKKLDELLLAIPLLITLAIICFAVTATLAFANFSLPIFSLIGVVLGLISLHRVHKFTFDEAYRQANVAADAKAEALEASMNALQAQMNPHFLFNTLNTVASLVRYEPKRAEATVESLAKVLRRTLEHNSARFCTVAEELDYLKAYLAIEQERFEERLTVHWTLDEAANPCHIPPMTLQPLVENAIKHGVANKIGASTVRIKTQLVEGVLELSVNDDGPGFKKSSKPGIGLGNLEKRLENIYHQNCLELPKQGSLVLIRIPQEENDEDINRR